MINPKELRIGNFFINTKKNIEQITGIDIKEQRTSDPYINDYLISEHGGG